MPDISLPIDADAAALLSRSPLSLLIAMLLDQQVPMERAFTAPRDLARRLGHDPASRELADYDPEALAALFSAKPALHRYPKAMAGRVQRLCQLIAERHGGDASAVWDGARTGEELLARISDLPGFGPDKARILVAFLGKRCGVTPPGWREAAGAFGAEGSRRSVADIVDQASLAEVRAHKQSLKAASKSAR